MSCNTAKCIVCCLINNGKISILRLWYKLNTGLVSLIIKYNRFAIILFGRAEAHPCKTDKAHWYYFIIITKTRLYNCDPLKPHFYIVKLGFTGVYIIFLIFAQKHRLWVLVRTAYPQSMFWSEIWKISVFFYLKKFSFRRWKFL